MARSEAEEYAGPERAAAGRILLVEDNEEVGEFAESLLGELGHEVIRVALRRGGARAALDSGFDVVFTDVVMPGMSGLELADAARRTAAAAAGDPDHRLFSDEIARSGAGGRPVILKPYRLETLAAAIDQGLGRKDQ